jgi:hypothetical protein
MRVATTETRTVAVGVSLAILLAAFFVFMRAGEYQSLGPLDLETADRLALALWVAAPVAGGLAARRFSNRGLARAALALGLPVGLAAALFVLFASGTGDYVCPINLPAFPGGYPLGCLAFGALAGLGMGIGFLVGGVAGRRPVTVLPGVVLAGTATLATSTAAYLLFYGAVRCLR